MVTSVQGFETPTKGEFHLPAARQRGNGRLLHLGAEADAGEHLLDLAVRGVAGICRCTIPQSVCKGMESQRGTGAAIIVKQQGAAAAAVHSA